MTEVKQDLLIVTDEGDFLRKQALRVVYALQNVYPEYTAEVRRFSDHRDIPELINFCSKKLVFLTWGYDFHQKVYTTKFLKSSTIQSNNDRFMLTLAKDLDGKPIDILDVHFDEFNDKNRMTVVNMRLVETWWPQMVAFLFDIPTTQLCYVPKWEYHTRLISEGDKPVKCVDAVNSCMEYFNVKINSQPVPDYRGCNVVLCAGNFPHEATENSMYISDSYTAAETSPYQYNKEHLLAGLLRIYSKTGLIKKPMKERAFDCIRRSFDTIGLTYCAGKCWEICKSGVRPLSEYPSLQMNIMFYTFILGVLGTGLPYWRGLVNSEYDGPTPPLYYKRKHILYGLFQTCTSEYSYTVGNCAVLSYELPGWWQLLIALCCLVIVLHLVSYFMIIGYPEIGTICNLLAGLLCLMIVLIWWQLSENFICFVESCDKLGTNELHASFYIFVAITISYCVWIPCVYLHYYCNI